MSRRFSVAGPWINDGSLPAEWEELVDPETGKSYFVDHANKITSWVDPRDLFMKPEKFDECADGGFALGWERAFDPIDGEYFIDHNTWTTTLKDPRLPPANREMVPLQTQNLMDESIGPLSARTSVYHEQDEMFERMSEYISQNEQRSQRLQDRVEELEDELQNKSVANERHGSAAGVAAGERARAKELEAQMALMVAQSQNVQADSRFRKQQQEIEELKSILKSSTKANRGWEDNLQTFVAANATTEIKTASKGTTQLSKANVEALDNSTRKTVTGAVQLRERRRSSSPMRRRLSRYNSDSGASDFEYEAMTAEMDRLEDIKRSHQSRITELRVRSASASGSGGPSNRAKLLAAAGDLGEAVGGVTDSRTSFGESH